MFERTFLAADADLQSWAAIEPYFDQLRDRDIGTVDSLEIWLKDFSELAAAIDEVGTDRYVKMACQTDDESRKQAYLDYVENIQPNCKKRNFELEVKYAKSPAAARLDKHRYQVLDRNVRADVDLFREKNVALQTEESKLEQQYQEISGAMTVEFDGQERTLQQLAPYGERTDRDIRQQAWEVETKRRLQDAGRLDDLFDQMIKLRTQIARNADCPDFRAYAFKAKHRFDYTPADCEAFHEAVAVSAVPAIRSLQAQRKAALGVETLKPWDMAVDVKGRDPLQPFGTVEELCTKSSKVFHRINDELGGQFDDMQTNGYLDLESRKGKAPGGFQVSYEEGRHPFIFMNAVGVSRDVSTMIHEGGHAFHTYACRQDPLVTYRSSPIEFAEVASFGMEMLSLEVLDEFYGGEDLARARRKKLEGIVGLFPWVATIDAFQHWLYTNPDHSRDDRRAHWLSLRERFGGIADYTGYEDALAYNWQRQLHLFQVPFYYIEYGIAKLGALQVWANAKQDRQDAIAKYRAALALGGSRPLPELFTSAGAKFDFSEKTVAPMIALLMDELDALPE